MFANPFILWKRGKTVEGTNKNMYDCYSTPSCRETERKSEGRKEWKMRKKTY